MRARRDTRRQDPDRLLRLQAGIRRAGRPGKTRQERDSETGDVAQNLRLQGSPAAELGVKVIVLVFQRASQGQPLP